MSGHRSSLNEKITLCPGFDKLIWLELKTSLLVPVDEVKRHKLFEK